MADELPTEKLAKCMPPVRIHVFARGLRCESSQRRKAAKNAKETFMRKMFRTRRPQVRTLPARIKAKSLVVLAISEEAPDTLRDT